MHSGLKESTDQSRTGLKEGVAKKTSEVCAAIALYRICADLC